MAHCRSSILRQAAGRCLPKSLEVRGRCTMQPCGKPCRLHGGLTCPMQRSTCSAPSASSASACDSWSLCDPPCSLPVHATDTAPATLLTRCSGLLQEELEYHQSTGYDILFECRAVADKLSLHVIAADCEWALARLWKTESVYTRAALDLTPSALQRIARSLCAGTDAARTKLASHFAHYGHYGGTDAREKLSKCLDEIASAQIMMEWRMSKDG